MRLTKYTHACVRLDGDGQSLVIDPGVFSEPAACDGVAAILVTHEHPDHLNVELLPAVVERSPAVRIYAGAAVTGQLSALGQAMAEAVVTVSVGDVFTAAGHTVHAVGGQHAEVYDGWPGIPNLGYIVDGEVYHPGDALFVPDEPVSTLLLPVGAPWLKTAEMLDFVRAVAPRQAFPIHDATYSEIGQSFIDGWAQRLGQTDYRRIPIASSVDLG